MAEDKFKKDADLMQKIAERDKFAFEQLYEMYSPLLYSLIKVIAKNKVSAEKVLTDVFKIVWERTDEFDFNTNNVYTWLIILTRNKTIDEVKRLNKNSDLPDYDEEFEKLYILPKLAQEIKPIGFNDAMNFKNKMSEEFKKLTDAQKYVLNLIFFDGLNEKEVAEKLNIPAPTIRTKLQVAMGNLSERLGNIN